MSKLRANSSTLPSSYSEDFTTSLDIFSAVLDIVGIFGNVASFVALLRCVRSASMYLILRVLAIGDTIFLTCHLVFQLASYYNIIYINRLTKCIGYTYVANVAITVIVWTTVLLSVERLVAVCYPLKHREIFSKGRTIVLLTIVWIASLVCRIPGFYQRLVQILAKPVNNARNLTVSVGSNVTSNQDAVGNFIHHLQVVLWSAEAIASIAIVFACNVIILVTLFRHIKQWSSVRNKHRQEMMATRLPLWVIAMFLLSEMPKKICGLLLLLGTVTPSYFTAMVAFCDICTLLNSSTNIMVYFACSKSIRSKLVMAMFSSLTRNAEVTCCKVVLNDISVSVNTTAITTATSKKRVLPCQETSDICSLVCLPETQRDTTAV